MALDVTKIGTTTGPHTATIEPERAKAYAAATNDDNPAYTSGKYAPPVFGVVPTWDAVIGGGGGVIPPHQLPAIAPGAHDKHIPPPPLPRPTPRTPRPP